MLYEIEVLVKGWMRWVEHAVYIKKKVVMLSIDEWQVLRFWNHAFESCQFP